MTLRVDLVVPVKPLPTAKTRLRGAADGGVGDLDAHLRLALALARDTVLAAVSATAVRDVLVISSDPAVAMEVGALGVRVVTDPGRGLNGALRHGARLLRNRDGRCMVGALQADLPALRPAELDDAVGRAAERFASGTRRMFQPDEPGIGTTLLLAAPGSVLDPRFGGPSAAAHRQSGAVEIPGDRPSLRRDVDTAADLEDAVALGVGAWTRSAIGIRDATARHASGRNSRGGRPIGPVPCPEM